MGGRGNVTGFQQTASVFEGVSRNFGCSSDGPYCHGKSQMAVTLKYYADGSKVPANIRPAKAGVDGPKQICVNCMFYAKTQGEKEKEIGKCQLFPKGLVPGKAWCASWTKKP
jgi:hypothetical protein